MRRVGRISFAAARLAAAILFARPCPAMFIRHDVPDAKYLERAGAAEFDCVGRLEKGGRLLGSGVLVHAHWMVTDAHVVEGMKPEELEARVGSSRSRVKSIAIHPDYAGEKYKKETTPLARKGIDVALVELASDVAEIRPAALLGRTLKIGEVITICGFGKTGTGDHLQPIDEPEPKKRAGTNVIDAIGGDVEGPIPDWYCVCDFDAPDGRGRNRCGDAAPTPLECLPTGGDSGCGAFVEVDGAWQLVALYSTTRYLDTEAKNAMTYGDIGMFTRLDLLRDWLQTTTARSSAPDRPPSPVPPLPFPGSLAQQQRRAGNPLATYAALVARQAEYEKSAVFAGIYAETRCNYEEFLGDPGAGERAMSLPALRRPAPRDDAPLPDGFIPRDALQVIVSAAARTRLVIFGEEHHLPQTRCLYEAMLRELRPLGYGYLAAEAFTDSELAPGFQQPDYTGGYYLMDPVFADAVRTAVALGYRLVAYDTAERGPPGDGSFRDRTQAQNLNERVFARDPNAKLLVLCGRGHAAEIPPSDGWTPMASVLKQITGIDPFTIYAPTMTQRATRAEEDPIYRYATAHDLVRGPTIFVTEAGDRCLGSGNCDAQLFLPRVQIVDGRPDWMTTALARRAVAVPESLRAGSGLRLVQAFPEGAPATVVPVDQVLLRDGAAIPALMLPHGSFWLRTIDGDGAVVGPVVVHD